MINKNSFSVLYLNYKILYRGFSCFEVLTLVKEMLGKAEQQNLIFCLVWLELNGGLLKAVKQLDVLSSVVASCMNVHGVWALTGALARSLTVRPCLNKTLPSSPAFHQRTW